MARPPPFWFILYETGFGAVCQAPRVSGIFRSKVERKGRGVGAGFMHYPSLRRIFPRLTRKRWIRFFANQALLGGDV